MAKTYLTEEVTRKNAQKSFDAPIPGEVTIVELQQIVDSAIKCKDTAGYSAICLLVTRAYSYGKLDGISEEKARAKERKKAVKKA